MHNLSFTFCTSTQTVRLMPANYLVAYRQDGRVNGRWLYDPDQAIPAELRQKVAVSFFSSECYNNRYSNGPALVESFNKIL